MGTCASCVERDRNEPHYRPITLVGEPAWPSLNELVDKEAERLFAGLDLNNDKKLDTEEYERMSEQLSQMGYAWVEPFETYDKDGSGTIDIVEFKAVFKSKVKSRGLVLQQMFQSDAFAKSIDKVFSRVDADHSGSVSADELYSLILECAQRLDAPAPPEARIADLINTFDKDRSRVLSREGFGNLMQRFYIDMFVHGRVVRVGPEWSPITLVGEPAWPSLKELVDTEAERVFAGLDLNNDKRLDTEEYARISERLAQMGYVWSQPFEAYDKDGNGSIDIAEFKAVFKDKVKSRGFVLQQMFQSDAFATSIDKVFSRVDADHSGAVSVGELYSLVLECAQKLDAPAPSEDQVEDLINMFDKDRNRVLTRDEFGKLMQMFYTNMFVHGRMVGAKGPGA